MNCVVSYSQALTEIGIGHVVDLDNVAGLGYDLPHRRLTVEAGAFVEIAVLIIEPLGERTCIVRVDIQELIVVDWNRQRGVAARSARTLSAERPQPDRQEYH
jgi:hypothetical protein